MPSNGVSPRLADDIVAACVLTCAWKPPLHRTNLRRPKPVQEKKTGGLSWGVFFISFNYFSVCVDTWHRLLDPK
jgi:hypothetical protein